MTFDEYAKEQYQKELVEDQEYALKCIDLDRLPFQKGFEAGVLFSCEKVKQVSEDRYKIVLERIAKQDQQRGYPTGSEWKEIMELVKNSLK